MIEVFAPLGLVGFALLIWAFVRTARQQNRERLDRFIALADERGWRFVGDDDGTAMALSKGFSGFASFKGLSGEPNNPYNVVVGDADDLRICLFNHGTRVDRGDARLWFVCLIESPERLGPPFQLRSRSVRRSVALGGDPVVALSDSRFEEEFEVRSPAPTETRAWLDPRIRDYISTQTRTLPFPIDAQNREFRIAVYPAERNVRIESVEDLQALVDFTLGLARILTGRSA